jgi:hypothetical protein
MPEIDACAELLSRADEEAEIDADVVAYEDADDVTDALTVPLADALELNELLPDTVSAFVGSPVIIGVVVTDTEPVLETADVSLELPLTEGVFVFDELVEGVFVRIGVLLELAERVGVLLAIPDRDDVEETLVDFEYFDVYVNILLSDGVDVVDSELDDVPEADADSEPELDEDVDTLGVSDTETLEETEFVSKGVTLDVVVKLLTDVRVAVRL